MSAILQGRHALLSTRHLDVTAGAATKGDFISSDGTTWQDVAVGANDTTIVADSSQTVGWKWAGYEAWVVKTADQTLTQSSTTLEDVTGLSYALAASTSYAVEVQLLLNAAGTAADWKFGWTYPASATIFWGPHTQGTTVFFWTPVGTGVTPDTLLVETDTYSGGSANATTGVIFRGVVRNSTNAGTLQLQASQNTSSATDNKVLKDSFLKIRKLQ